MIYKHLAVALAIVLLPSLFTGAKAQPKDFKMQSVWLEVLPPEMEEIRGVEIVGNHLFALSADQTPPVLYRLQLTDRGTTGTATALPLTGLPEGVTPTTLDVHEPGGSLFLLQSGREENRLFRARISRGDDIGEWTELPLPDTESPIRDSEFVAGETIFLFRAKVQTAGGEAENRAWLMPSTPQDDGSKWQPLPPLPDQRTDYALLPIADMVLYLGGHFEDEGRRPPMIPIYLEWDSPDAAWRELARPLAEPVPHAEGVATGGAIYLANQSSAADGASSLTLQFTVDRGEGNLSFFRKMILAQPNRPLVDLAVDEMHNRLVVLTREPEGFIATAYPFPGWLAQSPPSPEERRREMYKDLLPRPAQITPEEALERAQLNDMLVLYVITANEDEDFDVRLAMRAAKFRYMIEGSVLVYKTGREGKAILDHYGISETPAYILVDQQGALLNRYTGSAPSPTELLDLTAPIRAPRGPAETPAGEEE